MLEKANITTNGAQVTLTLPFSKFDEKKRIVSGFATLDNIDQTNDCVTAAASEKAFNVFRGNVREQHNKSLAVGKVVNIKPQSYYDPKTEKVYNGLFVDAYISKGAQDTWEKVLDGTLSGFSVHGNIKSEHSEYIPERRATVRYVDEYTLDELSLVDSPGNELCNILSIQKSADGSTTVNVNSMPVIENVFWCKEDELALISIEDYYECNNCKSSMDNLGWFELMPEDNKAEKIKEILDDTVFSKREGGSKLSEEVTEVATDVETSNVEETKDAVTSEDVVKPAEEVVAKDSEEDVTEVTESETDLEDITKALDEIKDTLAKFHELGKTREESLTKVRETVDGVEAKVDSKLAEVLAKHDALAGEFVSFKESLNTVEKRLDTVETGTALKKSVDTGENTLEKSKKESKWSGAFLPPSFDRE